MTDPEVSRREAQQRVDRIRAFERELARLEREDVLALSPESRERLAAYHAAVRTRLQERFDVDTSASERRTSWGMRIVSTLGALALAVAAYFFFYRFWGALSTPIQVLILIAAPCLAVAGMELASRREQTLYFTGLIGAIAFSCFVLDLSVLGAIFNITPSQWAFLPWGVFPLLLAYAYGLRMMLAAGILSLMVCLTATVGTLGGSFWTYTGERPENYIVAGIAAFAFPFLVRARRHDEFAPVYRIVGMLATFIAIFVLANWGASSHLRLDPGTVEAAYQIIGFLLAGLAIWLGIRRELGDVANMGAMFFIFLLLSKFFDWWWDWMPKYLFFLLVGSIAIGVLVVLRHARRTLKEVSA